MEDMSGVVEEYEKIRSFSVLIVGQDPSLWTLACDLWRLWSICEAVGI